jgi:uncharacterized delta-60 repeat protein
MKKIVLLGAGLLLVQLPLFALILTQERTWGGAGLDEALSVATAPDNSVYVAGRTLSFGAGDQDAFLLKYDGLGQLVWQQTYGTAPSEPFFRADETAQGVATSPDGSAIYITGQFGDGRVFLVKFDPDGGLTWQRTLGDNGDFARAVAVAADGSVYITGGTVSRAGVQGDVFLAKFTPDGALAWNLRWGAAGHDTAYDLAIDAAGSVYVAGETNSFVANDAFLLKVSPAGIVLWERDWGALDRDGFPGLTSAWGVGTASDGSIYITGSASDIGADPNIILVKFDTNGNVVWQKIGGPGFGAGLDVAVAGDGAIFVTGNFMVESRDVPDAFGGHAFVAEYQPDGKKKKAVAWGGADHESANAESIAISSDGSVVAAGYAQSPPYVTDSTGNSARTVDAFLQVVSGTISHPIVTVNDAPGGVVSTPAGSETFAGEFDAVMLRLSR